MDDYLCVLWCCPYAGSGSMDCCGCPTDCGCCAGRQYSKKNLPIEDYEREVEHRRLDREAQAEGIRLPPYPGREQMSVPQMA